MSSRQLDIQCAYIGFFHALGNYMTNYSMSQVAVSFTHTIKVGCQCKSYSPLYFVFAHTHIRTLTYKHIRVDTRRISRSILSRIILLLVRPYCTFCVPCAFVWCIPFAFMCVGASISGHALLSCLCMVRFVSMVFQASEPLFSVGLGRVFLHKPVPFPV